MKTTPDVINRTSRLRAIRKAAESLQMQVAVANIRLHDASRRVGAILGALHALNILELFCEVIATHVWPLLV
jgi:hypothetical protein